MRVLLANDKADDRLQAILCKLISEINAIFLVWKFFLI